MKGAEIRSRFLKFFEKNGHTIIDSSSLVPSNDPTLLFTNAGMVQFKDVFLGKDKRAYTRATTSQKCVRAGGKHNDLENVGFTARHHTFFEMLGNFSFGDYFKKDAIRFAWQFVTQELKLDKNRLFVTVYKDDDEAAKIWNEQEGVPLDRIYRFDEKDNFWAMGDTGPCGPCSEIFIDRGERYGCGKSTCKVGCDCDRFMEFWNLVFMQFNRDESGKLNPLPKPSVDTGAGLERIASILQEVDTNYDTDLFTEIMRETGKLAGKTYDRKDPSNVSFRVIADHSRASAFLVGDGVMPSNEGRGYVLRRIIRRAIRHGKKLGFTAPFLHKTCGFVIQQMRDAYPEMIEKRAFIEKVVLAEEEQFFKTLERGLALLETEIKALGSKKTLSGEIAFKLYDTFGFPLDLTSVICSESGISIDQAGFDSSMEKQRSESRKHWKGTGDKEIHPLYHKITERLGPQSMPLDLLNKNVTETTSKALAVLVRDADSLTEAKEFEATPGADAYLEVVFEKSHLYGESGGQIGDIGSVFGNGFKADLVDTIRPTHDLTLAILKPLQGKIQTGQTYTQKTDSKIRALTSRNHTATHLLHWALREVLGSHVKQAGSLVNSELLRFDFAHFQAMTPDEIQKVEALVNNAIQKGDPVSKVEMDKDAALKSGAIAFFGEKYGAKVRVINVGGYSVEFCGGAHVDRSSDIHLFKIASESGIAAGVRRIIAYTSSGAFDYLSNQDRKLKQIQDLLKASSPDEIATKIEKIQSAEKELKRQLEKLTAQGFAQKVTDLLQSAKKIGSTPIVLHVFEPLSDGIKALREISDQMKQKSPNGVFVLGTTDLDSQKAFLLIAVGSAAPKTVKANELLSQLAPMIDGKGGGKPDLAQAGGSKPAMIQKTIESSFALLETLLGKSK